ncbi:MAG: hypothetical protein WAL12_00285 [Trebonia sp.]
MVEQRYRAVLEVVDGIPVTEVAERFGITVTAPRTNSRDIRQHQASNHAQTALSGLPPERR